MKRMISENMYAAYKRSGMQRHWLKFNLYMMIFGWMLFLAGCSTIITQKQLHDQSPMYHGKEQESICWNSMHATYNRPMPIAYSGTWFDAHYLISGPFTCHGEDCWAARLFYPISLTLGLIDLPLSLVADTVLLPYTYNIKSSRCKDYKEEDRFK